MDPDRIDIRFWPLQVMVRGNRAIRRIAMAASHCNGGSCAQPRHGGGAAPMCCNQVEMSRFVQS